jgi:hypothetical protein
VLQILHVLDQPIDLAVDPAQADEHQIAGPPSRMMHLFRRSGIQIQ